MKVLKNHSYLTKMDPVLVRSCMYLTPFSDLVEFTGQVDVELLDMLVYVLNNTPADITSSSVQVSAAGIVKGYHWEIKMETEIWGLCFTDSICCSSTHPHASH